MSARPNWPRPEDYRVDDDNWHPVLLAVTMSTGRDLNDICKHCWRFREEHTGASLACPEVSR